MIVKLLMVESENADFDYINNPTWEAVEVALNKMDGKNTSYLGLYKDEEPSDQEFLLVGGGVDRKNFVCCYFNDGDEYYVINPNEKNPDEVIDVPIGQMNRKERKYCNDFKDIIGPVKYFFENGTMSPEVQWEAV